MAAVKNRNVCFRVVLMKRKIIALEILHIQINACSSASTASLAKTKVITLLLTYRTAFSGSHFHVMQRKSLEIETCSITIRRTLSS